jgi:hypothetical protein
MRPNTKRLHHLLPNRIRIPKPLHHKHISPCSFIIRQQKRPRQLEYAIPEGAGERALVALGTFGEADCGVLFSAEEAVGGVCSAWAGEVLEPFGYAAVVDGWEWALQWRVWSGPYLALVSLLSARWGPYESGVRSMLQIMQVSGSGSFVFFLPLPFPLPLDVSDFFVAVFFFLAASDPSFVTFSDLRVLVTAAIFILLGETRADYSGNRCCRMQRVLRVIKAQVYLPRNAFSS